MIGWLVLIAVVVAIGLYITYDDFDPPDDPDACPSDGALYASVNGFSSRSCCRGGCHV